MYAPLAAVHHLVDETWIGRRIIARAFEVALVYRPGDTFPDEQPTGNDSADVVLLTLRQVDVPIYGPATPIWIAVADRDAGHRWIGSGPCSAAAHAQVCIEVTADEWAQRAMGPDEIDTTATALLDFSPVSEHLADVGLRILDWLDGAMLAATDPARIDVYATVQNVARRMLDEALAAQ